MYLLRQLLYCLFTFIAFGASAIAQDVIEPLWSTTRGFLATVNSACFNTYGDRIVTACTDHTTKIWNANTGTCLQTFEGHSNAVINAIYDQQGDRIVTYSYDSIAIVWTADGEMINLLAGHKGAVLNASFNPTGDRVVTASADSTAIVWNTITGAPVFTLRGHKGKV